VPQAELLTVHPNLISSQASLSQQLTTAFFQLLRMKDLEFSLIPVNSTFNIHPESDLSTSSIKTSLVQATVILCLDHLNSTDHILTLAPTVYSNRVARVTLIKCKSDHVTPLFKILQSLPLPLGVQGKLFTLTYRTLNERTTHCLSDVILTTDLLTLLHPKWTSMFTNMPSMLPPQDLCIFCFLPRMSSQTCINSFPHFVQLSGILIALHVLPHQALTTIFKVDSFNP